MNETDILVIGSGIAGLTYALKMAEYSPEIRITLLTKTFEGESNSRYAQGGIAVVSDNSNDSFDRHIADTLEAGDGLCEASIVEMVVKQGPALLNTLVKWGADFDRNTSGSPDLVMEGGHSKRRIFHFLDRTGQKITRALLSKVHQAPNIRLEQQRFAIDLITDQQQSTCYGAFVLNPETGETESMEAKITLLATGGIGQVYAHSTNPAIATGDGIAMAFRAHAEIADMEFVQFHPTALYGDHVKATFLISEAVRGYGAVLKNNSGVAFMNNYDDRGDLATRDIVARAIDLEIKNSGHPCVYLDCRHFNIPEFRKKFPAISEKCHEAGIDIQHDMIPVVPAAHYLCGGIRVNEHGQTSIHRLYACGECSRTGMHGANRLASNSLLEAVVFAEQCFQSSKKLLSTTAPLTPMPFGSYRRSTTDPDPMWIVQKRNELTQLMQDQASIVRSNAGLKNAQNHLNRLHLETARLRDQNHCSQSLYELRNMIDVGRLIVEHALKRKENRGAHYNADQVKPPVRKADHQTGSHTASHQKPYIHS